MIVLFTYMLLYVSFPSSPHRIPAQPAWLPTEVRVLSRGLAGWTVCSCCCWRGAGGGRGSSSGRRGPVVTLYHSTLGSLIIVEWSHNLWSAVFEEHNLIINEGGGAITHLINLYTQHDACMSFQFPPGMQWIKLTGKRGVYLHLFS